MGKNLVNCYNFGAYNFRYFLSICIYILNFFTLEFVLIFFYIFIFFVLVFKPQVFFFCTWSHDNLIQSQKF